MNKTTTTRWLLYAALLLLTACGGGTDSPDDGPIAGNGQTGVQFRLRAPTQFDQPFCVRIQVSGPGFSPVVSDRHFPAGTRVIETVTPNLPVGSDRRVELGIFEDDTCGDLAQADWYGLATDVTVNEGAVTLVQMDLLQQGGNAGTGSIIVRGDQTILATRLHGEVVDESATPIAGVRCEIQDRGASLGMGLSGTQPNDLGVLDTMVDVNPDRTQLTLSCTHPGYRNARVIAMKHPDPQDPRKGTFTATVIMHPGVQVSVLQEDEKGLVAELTIPEVQLKEVDTPAGRFQRIANREAFTLLGGGQGHTGQPEIPIFTTYVALPLGSEPETTQGEPMGDQRERSARLYPIQPLTRDAAGPEPGAPYPEDDERFRFDEARYAKTSIRAGEVLDFEPVAVDEERNIWRLRISLADFDGARGLLVTYPKIRLHLSWPLQAPCFSTVRQAADFTMDAVDEFIEQRPQPRDILTLNASTLKRLTCPIIVKPIFFGARLLIISHPDFLDAARSLRNHKISRGISTVVVSTDTIATNPTPADIQNYIRNARSRWWIRPQWVLLMGDAEFIPTYYDQNNAWDQAKNAGDIFYAQASGGVSSLPELGVGRLPVDTLSQAQRIVDKIIAYENKPVPNFTFGMDFFARLTFPAMFQDDDLDGQAERWFAETSEAIRDHLIGKGLAVERIYQAPAASNPTLWRDGGAVPGYLQRPTFAWDGDTNDIIDAVNRGTFILYHRDHGWWWGWGTPTFSTAHLASVSVSNDEYPIVYSINCASGIFDNETVDDPANIVATGYGPNPSSVYWAEHFLRKSDGAVAVIGDTRSSATTLNNDLAHGLFDATWPDYQPYGPATPITYLGDVLNHAKGFVKSQGYSNTAERQELVIYNLLGDPTLQVRTRRPYIIKIKGLLLAERVVEVSFEPQPPCLKCPPEPLKNPVVVVAQDGKGNVLARTVTRTGEARLMVGDVQGPVKVTLSGEEVVTVQEEIAPSSPPVILQ